MIDDKAVGFGNCWIMIWSSLSVVPMVLCPVYWWSSIFTMEKQLSNMKEYGVAKQFYHYLAELMCVEGMRKTGVSALSMFTGFEVKSI